MKKIDFGQTISIVANLGVIAGILLLVLEIRQNNELMSDEAQRARSESIREGFLSMAENGELAAIWVKERSGERLTAVEEHRLGNYWMRGVLGYQTSFQQLPREELEAYKAWFRGLFERSPSWRNTWELYRGTFQPDFVEFMEEEVFVKVSDDQNREATNTNASP